MCEDPCGYVGTYVVTSKVFGRSHMYRVAAENGASVTSDGCLCMDTGTAEKFRDHFGAMVKLERIWQ